MSPSNPSAGSDPSAPSDAPPIRASDRPADDEVSIEHNAGNWIAYWAEQQPTALAWADDHRRCDYAQAEDRIRRLTNWFATQGVSRGDRIAVWLGNRGATLEATFAAARLGAIVLPVNARLTPEEVAFQLDDARPHVLLVERAWRPRAAAALQIQDERPPLILEVGSHPPQTTDPTRPVTEESPADPSEHHGDAYEEALATASASRHCEAVRADDAMILMYTSGTTGKPKGALLPHRKALFNAKNAELYFGITSSDRVLVVAPLFHSLGLQILALPALHAGAGIVIQDGFDADRVWHAVEEEKISYYGGVPTMHQRLLEALDRRAEDARPPASLRFAFTAGAAAGASLIRSFHEHGLLMKQGYGQTETSTLTCLEESLALEKAGSVGRPVTHVEIRLIAPHTIEGDVEAWRDVVVGEVGEIVARGPITMLGYWERPEESAQTLRGEWLRTGDLATRDEDFDITLVGRAREMYISGGENVYPAEVEAAIAMHPDVEEVAVVAIPDPDWGEIGRAHIVPMGDRTIDVEALSDWLQPKLARFKQPRAFVIESTLPRTASGKVQKHILTRDASAEASGK